MWTHSFLSLFLFFSCFSLENWCDIQLVAVLNECNTPEVRRETPDLQDSRHFQHSEVQGVDVCQTWGKAYASSLAPFKLTGCMCVVWLLSNRWSLPRMLPHQTGVCVVASFKQVEFTMIRLGQQSVLQECHWSVERWYSPSEKEGRKSVLCLNALVPVEDTCLSAGT